MLLRDTGLPPQRSCPTTGAGNCESEEFFHPCLECAQRHPPPCSWLHNCLDNKLLKRVNYSRGKARFPHYDLIRLDTRPLLSLDKFAECQCIQALFTSNHWWHILSTRQPAFPAELPIQRTASLKTFPLPVRPNLVPNALVAIGTPLLSPDLDALVNHLEVPLQTARSNLIMEDARLKA